VRYPRESAHQRGYNWTWRRFAKQYLTVHPLCVLCQQANRITPARVVDHIDAEGPKGPKGFDESNLRALCKDCHDLLDGQNNPRQGCDANGYPLG
jgi:5-methylcytosine-specific restriction protein A